MQERKYSLYKIKDMDEVAFHIRNLDEALRLKAFLDNIGWRSVKNNSFDESWIEAMSNGNRAIRIKKGKRGSVKYYEDEGYTILTFDDIGTDVVMF